MVRDGASYAKAIAKYKVSYSTIRRELRKMGVPQKPRGKPRKEP